MKGPYSSEEVTSALRAHRETKGGCSCGVTGVDQKEHIVEVMDERRLNFRSPSGKILPDDLVAAALSRPRA